MVISCKASLIAQTREPVESIFWHTGADPTLKQYVLILSSYVHFSTKTQTKKHDFAMEQGYSIDTATNELKNLEVTK